MSKPSMEHRHFVLIADALTETLRSGVLSESQHADVTWTFADKLRATNPQFSRDRFIAAAMGKPCNGRDKVR
jgi:hypothetical protein